MDERRDYFRLPLDASIELKELPEKPTADADANSYFTSSHALQAMAELRRLELDGSQLQQQVKDADRALGEYLNILTRKIDLLAQFCLSTQITQPKASQSIELSENGLVFHHPTPLTEQHWLALMLSFESPLMAIALHAQVLRCEPDRGNGYLIAAQFLYLSTAQRQQISQHIMRAQLELARRKPH